MFLKEHFFVFRYEERNTKPLLKYIFRSIPGQGLG